MRSSASITAMGSRWRASCALNAPWLAPAWKGTGAPPTLEADLAPLRGSCRSKFPPKGLSDLRLSLAGMCQRDNQNCLRGVAVDSFDGQ
jgi:hypothetical protein